jgi:hypothetical protein
MSTKMPQLNRVLKPFIQLHILKFLAKRDIFKKFSEKSRFAENSYNFHQCLDVLYTHTHMSLMQYSSVADNARDAVLLHVSASSERQEWGNETGKMLKRTEHQILAHNEVCVPILLVGPLSITSA